MLVDLQLAGKKSLVIIFDEEEATKRLEQLIEAGCSEIKMITSNPIAKSICKKYRLASVVPVELDARRLSRISKITLEYQPFLTVVSTGLVSFDRKIAEVARKTGSLVYVVDSPKLNDLNMPAVARLGDVRVAISTTGKSPAMARILKQRIERTIRKEDILQVKLQGLLRDGVKKSTNEPGLRRKKIYALLRNKKIKTLLKQDRFEEAVQFALRIVQSNQERKG